MSNARHARDRYDEDDRHVRHVRQSQPSSRPGGGEWLLAFLVIAVFIASNVALGYTGIPGTGEIRSIAWEAHIGGFLAGFILFPLFDFLHNRGGQFGGGRS